jgi:hypothetical protein
MKIPYFLRFVSVFAVAVTTARGDDPTGNGRPIHPNSVELAPLVQLQTLLPNQLVPPLSGQLTGPLAGQITGFLPDQLVPPLPGQIVAPLPGSMVGPLPGQVAHWPKYRGQFLSKGAK